MMSVTCNHGTTSIPSHALYSTIFCLHSPDLILKLNILMYIMNKYIHVMNIAFSSLVFVSNVAGFILQITRVLYISNAFYKFTNGQLVQIDAQISYSRFDIENECSDMNCL